MAKEFVSLKKAWWVFLNYVFLAKINKWHLNPTGLTWCPKETQAFSLITLETSRGGLQIFSCHTFVTAVLLCRPKHFIPIGIPPLCLFSSHLHPLKADINYFQWFTLQIKSKSQFVQAIPNLLTEPGNSTSAVRQGKSFQLNVCHVLNSELPMMGKKQWHFKS